MPKKENEYLEYILSDVLARLSGITSRAMFGGYGIYRNGTIFAIIADDQLYFKVGESNSEDYRQAESEPFVYERGNHQKTTMSYWRVPEEVMEDPELVAEWAEKALVVSRSVQCSKPAKRKRGQVK